jgi:hypothetical protein
MNDKFLKTITDTEIEPAEYHVRGQWSALAEVEHDNEPLQLKFIF